MLDFLSVTVPDRLHSQWTRVHSTIEHILIANPSIMNYWIYVRRDSLYRQLSSLNLHTVEEIRTKILAKNDDISVSDIDQVYRLIRTSINIVINNDTCPLSYYAQTKQSDDETITICLNNRLLQSDNNAFVFVAAAVLFREISRAIWPECLKNTRSTSFLQNSLFYSWSGIPERLWPHKWKERKERINFFQMIYITCPVDGQTNVVSDAGNLFQHLFYNGEVHLYDDEIDDHGEKNVIHVALRVHQTQSSLCAARYLHEKLLDDFFNISQYSLEIIRQIDDQICPYFKYVPIEEKGNRVDEILLDIDKCVNAHNGFFSKHSVYYQFKPYEPKEPQQHYEQSLFIGYSCTTYTAKCGRIFEHTVKSDDTFYLNNSWLLRRRTYGSPDISTCAIQQTDAVLDRIRRRSVRTGI